MTTGYGVRQGCFGTRSVTGMASDLSDTGWDVVKMPSGWKVAMTSVVTDRVRRAWCDYDHPDTAEEKPTDHYRCEHAFMYPWEHSGYAWGLEDWLKILAFVADRADRVYRIEVKPTVWWITGSAGGGHRFDTSGEGLDELREAVIRAIDAILDHAQEGDE